MEINKAHLFKAGKHPGQNAADITFGESDLDSIVEAFNAAGQSGRVPLKFGHNDQQALTDGQPALGWVSKIWREAGNLYGNFSDVPAAVYNAVRKGLYKFTSIELLKDAQYAGRTFPWMLDAVALLGADIPAVNGLEDLQRLAASRSQPALKFDRRLTFTTRFDARDAKRQKTPAVSEPENAELTALRAENARLKASVSQSQAAAKGQQVAMARAAAVELLEGAVRAKAILPRQRLQFSRLLRLDDDEAVSRLNLADIEELTGLTADAAKKIMMSRSAGNRDPRQGILMEGTDQFAFSKERHVADLSVWAKQNGFSDVFSAWPEYLARHPDAARGMSEFCFETVS
jgi:hypothetical protein